MNWDDLEREKFTVGGMGNGGFKVGGQAPPWAMGGGFGGGISPFMLGAGISGITGNTGPQTFNESNDDPGAFSQLGDAIGGIPAKVGGAIGQGIGAVGDFLGWDDMKPMERAWLLSQAVGTGMDVWSQHKAGQEEDEEKRKRQRSAEALRPFIQHMMSGNR